LGAADILRFRKYKISLTHTLQNMSASAIQTIMTHTLEQESAEQRMLLVLQPIWSSHLQFQQRRQEYQRPFRVIE
jgi:hypothetical protein